MQYFSTNRQSPSVNFAEATLAGQAPDKGLYFPQSIPSIPTNILQNLASIPSIELAVTVLQPYVKDCIPQPILEEMVAATIDFGFPLIPITDKIASFELFHGPTLAFKDVGARFMSRCLGYFNRGNERLTTVLVATSGDTGGAVANGFDGVEGVEVIILYPSGKVSPVQELQLTTCGNNITALEVSGNFDDCQAMVKQAFLDVDLAKAYQLTSANSINVARWLPQQLYYFFALQQWQHAEPPIVSVPCGNFGNICAGLLAQKAGLPIELFLAACNANDVIPRFMQTGKYDPITAIATISNAMDVGNPSNFIRILEMFAGDKAALSQALESDSVSDTDTISTIKKVYFDDGYILDPHGAVAYQVLDNYLTAHANKKGFFLATAHPVKFPEVVEQAIGVPLPIPEKIQPLFSKQKTSIAMAPSFGVFKEWMLRF